MTCIRDAYTLAAAHEAYDGEMDGLMIRQFLETLAEVALSVASRKAKQENRQPYEVTR